MTPRKPPGMRWESWIDRQVRDAHEGGEFEDLPGAGQPIPDLAKTRDENWRIKDKLRREGLTYIMPVPYDVERVVRDWQAQNPMPRSPATPSTPRSGCGTGLRTHPSSSSRRAPSSA